MKDKNLDCHVDTLLAYLLKLGKDCLRFGLKWCDISTYTNPSSLNHPIFMKRIAYLFRHLELHRIEVLFIQLTLIEGFVLFPHINSLRRYKKCAENVVLHILHGSKIHVVSLRYTSCTSLIYNTYESYTTLVHILHKNNIVFFSI
jgi:hypothetical protein